MDEFGVLVESIGFKAQGKSAPMADMKNRSPVNIPRSAYNSTSTHRSFNSNVQHQNHGVFGGFDDVFGGFSQDAKPSGDGFDLDSIFKGSGNLGRSSSMYADDDIFGGMPAQRIAPVDDLFGDFAGMGLGSNGSRRTSTETKKSGGGFGNLIPGFGESNATRNRENTGTIRPPPSAGHSVKSANNSAGDPFIVLEQSSSHAYTSGINSKPDGQGTKRGSVSSSVNDFEDFVMGGQRKNTTGQSDLFQKEQVETAIHDLDSFFHMGTRPTNTSAESAAVDPVFDSLFQDKRSSANEKRGPGEGKSSGRSASMQKASSQTNIVDDFSLFFGEASPSSCLFQEVEGESEERRRARLNHHMRTQNRMAQALAEKNERDLQAQWEQEERHRIAETQDEDIKRWAAGKEGNLRALLSSLQHVLWPECGWQPVSLTDLITSVSVKKVYHKATLCVHPDKVQQKGANVQQKYIAEKVFDLLKEAWNKFNAEELR